MSFFRCEKEKIDTLTLTTDLESDLTTTVGRWHCAGIEESLRQKPTEALNSSSQLDDEAMSKGIFDRRLLRP